jgi:diguanylate cyclase (GGDEF)-like protein
MPDLPPAGGARSGLNRPVSGLSASGWVRRWRFTILGTVLVAAILGADAIVISMQRAQAIADFTTATTNLANGMAAQTSQLLLDLDMVLHGARDMLAANPDLTSGHEAEVLRGPAVTRLLAGRELQHLTGLDALAVVDATGKVANGSGAWPSAGTDLSNQDFFRHLAARDDGITFVGAPQPVPGAGTQGPGSQGPGSQGPGSQGMGTQGMGTMCSLLAVRLDGPQGELAGIVLARISLAALENIYRVAMPAHRGVTLSRQDGTVIVHYPAMPQAVGRRPPPGAAWYAVAASGGGAYLSPGYFGASPALSVMRPVRGLPLVVEATVSQADVLAGWERQRVWLIIGGLAASLFSGLVVHQFARQIHRLGLQNIALDTARTQMNIALSNISQGLCFFDGDLRLIVCNARYGEIYGLPPSAMQPGTPLQEIIDHFYASGGVEDVTRDGFLMARATVARNGVANQSVIRTKDGRTIAIQQQPMLDGGWVATHEDITERRRVEEQINFMARHDALTGLANRSSLRDHISQACTSAARGADYAVLFLDLDRFKAVNDTLGHAAGDELLRQVAARLLGAVRADDVVARLGGDEFVVLATGRRTADEAAVLAERIIGTIAAPYMIGDNEVVIGVSIGIEVARGDCRTADDLLKNADTALYIAKGEGRGTFRFFAPDMDAAIQNRHALERDLAHAIARGQIEVLYQAIVDARSGRTGAFEATLRWNHPELGQVDPGTFITVAEECGLIVPIGEWLISQACRQAATWPETVRVAVNLSPVQFRVANLVDLIRGSLASAGLAPARLELEITEAVFLHNTERNIAILHQLRACGVAIVLDGFGAGHTSLGHVCRFPFDRIKMEPSLVRELTASDAAVYVVRAITGLCRDLAIRTTADGVQTAQQRSLLVAEGCNDLQGPLFASPEPASRLTRYLAGAPALTAPVLH